MKQLKWFLLSLHMGAWCVLVGVTTETTPTPAASSPDPLSWFLWYENDAIAVRDLELFFFVVWNVKQTWLFISCACCIQMDSDVKACLFCSYQCDFSVHAVWKYWTVGGKRVVSVLISVCIFLSWVWNARVGQIVICASISFGQRAHVKRDFVEGRLSCDNA